MIFIFKKAKLFNLADLFLVVQILDILLPWIEERKNRFFVTLYLSLETSLIQARVNVVVAFVK